VLKEVLENQTKNDEIEKESWKMMQMLLLDNSSAVNWKW
jgi:hypothetical protein